MKIHNEAGVTAPPAVSSPNALPLHKRSTAAKKPENVIPPQEVENRWLDVSLNTEQPLAKNLSGLPLEYRVIELYNTPKIIKSNSGFAKVGKAVMNDWQISGITTLQPGCRTG